MKALVCYYLFRKNEDIADIIHVQNTYMIQSFEIRNIFFLKERNVTF